MAPSENLKRARGPNGPIMACSRSIIMCSIGFLYFILKNQIQLTFSVILTSVIAINDQGPLPQVRLWQRSFKFVYKRRCNKLQLRIFRRSCLIFVFQRISQEYLSVTKLHFKSNLCLRPQNLF